MDTVGMASDRRRTRLPSYLRAALKLVPDKPRFAAQDDLVGAYPTFTDPVCDTIGVSEFYPDSPRENPGSNGQLQPELRRTICGSCIHQTDCMTWALRNEAHGLWALTEKERASLKGRALRTDTIRLTPDEAALSAVRDGIDPMALAEALIAVHGTKSAVGRPVVEAAPQIVAAAEQQMLAAS